MVHPVIIHFRWGCSILNQQFFGYHHLLETRIFNFNRIFNYKPSSCCGYLHLWNPQLLQWQRFWCIWGSRKGSDYQELEARAWISRLSKQKKKNNVYIITYVCIMVSKHIRCKPAKLRGSLEINSEMVPAQFFLPKQCVHTEGFLRLR